MDAYAEWACECSLNRGNPLIRSCRDFCPLSKEYGCLSVIKRRAYMANLGGTAEHRLLSQ